MIRILIADDHTMFINGLQMLLSSNGNYDITAIAHNGKEILDLLTDHKIDLILMDINMPIVSGYEATLLITKKYPDVKIIALSMLADAVSVGKMLEAGVDGYIFKNANESELIEAIDTVMKGDYFVTAEMEPVLQKLLKKKKDVDKGYATMETNPLSVREIEILKFIMNGLTNNEIADRLFLSPRTVETHRKNILAKLEIKNTAGLVKYAIEKAVFLGLNE